MVVYGMLRSDEFRFCDLVYCVVLVLMKTQADGLSTNFVKPSETFCVQFKEIRVCPTVLLAHVVIYRSEKNG